MSMAEMLGRAGDVIHSMFLYAACTEDGYVKVGISRTPFERIAAINQGSPSPVKAAQWVWVGSRNWAMRMEVLIKREWKDRHTRGEWYRFDYADPADKENFHSTLSAVFEAMTKTKPEWKRLGPNDINDLLNENYAQWRKDKSAA